MLSSRVSSYSEYYLEQLEKQEELHQQQLQRVQGELCDLSGSFKNQTEQFKQLCRTNNQFITTIQSLNEELSRTEQHNIDQARQIELLDANYKSMR